MRVLIVAALAILGSVGHSVAPAAEQTPMSAAAAGAGQTTANHEDAAVDATAGKRMLGKMGYPFTEDAFGSAIMDGNKEAVRLFLRLGMNANHRFERGGPALVMAAGSCRREPEEPRLDILRAMLEAKPTVDAKTEHDLTPLLRTVIAGCPVEFVEALVRAGANVNVKTKTGFSVLSIAEERGYDDIVNVLRKAGAR